MKIVVNKVFTSRASGVLAGALVITGSIIFTTNLPRNLGGETATLFIIVFSIFPALIGLFVSLFNKSGKRTYLRIGITQIIIGLVLAGISYLMLGSYSFGPKYSYYWEYANLAVTGILIFIISGIYLVANNSKLRRKVDR